MKDKGLSNIITMLIIVTASVVLGTALILFASGIFATTVEEEAVDVSGESFWGNTTTTSQAAFVIKNTGSKELAIQEIKIRGIASPYSDWYYIDISDGGPGGNVTITTPLSYDPVPGSTLSLDYVTINGGNMSMSQANSPIGIKQGREFIIFVATPGQIDSSDAGDDLTMVVKSKDARAVVRSTIKTP